MRRLKMQMVLYVVRDGPRVKVKVPTATRLRAACELMDRCGLVRRSEQTLEIATAKPKLVEIRHFDPPASWVATSEPPALPPISVEGETVTVDSVESVPVLDPDLIEAEAE